MPRSYNYFLEGTKEMSVFVIGEVTFCLAALFGTAFVVLTTEKNKHKQNNNDYERKTISRPRAH
jgi:hypothetical protein